MKNVPFFQLFALVSVLIFSIENYRAFMFREENKQTHQADPITEKTDLLVAAEN